MGHFYVNILFFSLSYPMSLLLMGGACIAVLTFGEWGLVCYCGKLVGWVFLFPVSHLFAV